MVLDIKVVKIFVVVFVSWYYHQSHQLHISIVHHSVVSHQDGVSLDGAHSEPGVGSSQL
jgi:hypothetical protein